METVNIMHEALRKACMARPSDATWGKPHDGTATDWVTRGHLTLMLWWLNVQSSQCKELTSTATGKREHRKAELPKPVGMGTPCGKVYSLACA